MADPQPNELPVVQTQVARCRHLRSAGMYLYTDGSRDETADDYDSSSYWCSETAKAFGPDDAMVGGRECRDPARSCYQAI